MKWANQQEFEALLSKIRGNTAETFLFLDNEMTIQEITLFAESFQQNHTITHLYFNADFDDAKIVALSNGLQKSDHLPLKWLTLNKAHISLLGAESLAKLLQKNNGSLSLSLPRTINREGYKAFARLASNQYSLLSDLIFMAAKDRRIDIVRDLISLGVEVNRCIDRFEGTLLHLAVRASSPELVQIFCEAGAEVNSTKSGMNESEENKTPWELMDAAYFRKYKNVPAIARLLIKHGTRAETPQDLVYIPEHEILRNYQMLSSFIKKEHTSALIQGKKFIIVVGESHPKRRSLLIEIMILKIAHQLGMENILFEWDDHLLEFHERLKNIQDLNQKTDLPSAFDFLAASYVYLLSKSLGLKNYAICNEGLVDKDHHAKDKCMSETTRDLSISNAIIIMGAAHMQGFLERYPLGEEFHIAAINTYPTVTVNNYHVTAPQILQLEFSGNAELWEAEEVLEQVSKICRNEPTTQPLFSWQLFQMQYNAQKPNAERDGYGPGAIAVFSPK